MRKFKTSPCSRRRSIFVMSQGLTSVRSTVGFSTEDHLPCPFDPAHFLRKDKFAHHLVNFWFHFNIWKFAHHLVNFLFHFNSWRTTSIFYFCVLISINTKPWIKDGRTRKNFVRTHTNDPNSPTIPNPTKYLPSWFSMYCFYFPTVSTIALAATMVPIILIPNHLKSEYENIWISNGFWICMFGIQAPTVQV